MNILDESVPDNQREQLRRWRVLVRHHGLMKEPEPGGKTMHQYGDCSFCGGEVKSEKIELDYRYKGQLYIFQNVPASVCQQCGEQYLTTKVAKEIERRIQTKEQWDKTVLIPVGVFSAEALA